jgi:hypothetical protein
MNNGLLITAFGRTEDQKAYQRVVPNAHIIEHAKNLVLVLLVVTHQGAIRDGWFRVL